MINAPKEDKYSWISNAVGFVALLSAMNIFISVLFEFGYYHYGLGIQVPSIPTTMSDHIKACFMWIPFALSLITSFAACIFLVIIKTKETSISTTDDIQKEVTIWQALKPSKGFLLYYIFGFFALLFNHYFSPKLYFFWYIVIMLIIVLINHMIHALYMVYYNKFKSKKKYFQIMSLLPYIISMCVLTGYYTAQREIEPTKYRYEITLKEPSTPKIKANILRSYDKVTFFVYSSQKLVFMQNDQIKMITKN